MKEKVDNWKIMRLCSNCNDEYEVELARAGENERVSSIQPCPHCEATNHHWIWLKPRG